MKKRCIRWGILSTAKFGVNKLIPALQLAESCEVYAIASRNPTQAESVAAQLTIPTAYGSYEELLQDAGVDAIYNPLPNHLHVPWTIRALEAGKHVLCEKPLALSAPEARELLQAARRFPHLKVMEAFMYKFHPQWQRAMELVDKGQIGQLKTINSFFSFYNNDPGNIRNQPGCGGGALLDIGCYAISLSRYIHKSEPHRVMGMMEFDPAFKIDRMVSGLLEFKQGMATFTCSTQITPFQRVQILGTTGRIEVMIPFTPVPEQPCVVWHYSADKSEKIDLKVCNQYQIEVEQFTQAILHNTPVPFPLDDALANMKVIDAVAQSAKTGKWIELE